MDTYKIVRSFLSGRKRTVITGLTKGEAREHCQDPETSSQTCTESEGIVRTKRSGAWFDGFEAE